MALSINNQDYPATATKDNTTITGFSVGSRFRFFAGLATGLSGKPYNMQVTLSVGTQSKATGKIRTVNAGKKQFVLTGTDGTDWTFGMDENAKVLLNNWNSELGLLNSGDEAEVIYIKKGDQLFATQVKCERSVE
jgi:hypothetical protein